MRRLRPSRALAALSCAVCALAAPVVAQAAAPGPASVPGPSATGSYTATVLLPTVARSAPGSGRVVSRVSTTSLIDGGSNSLMVLGSATVGGTQYLKLRLPQRPNGLAGWVDANDLYVQADPWRIVVSIGSREALLYKNGRLYGATRDVVGAVGTPTPEGLFAISEDVPQPRGSVLGSYVITLTAHSDFLKTFEGGDGTVGIHGYELLGAPLGTRSSHGCVRVPESFVRTVLSLPEGTPVLIEGKSVSR